MKRKIYNFIVKSGLSILSQFFPDVHMSVPSKPGDRFLEYPFVFSRLPKGNAIKLIDIGCSGSFFPLIAASLGYEVVGCDIRPYEILNNLSFNNFTFVQKDICKSPLPEETFDVATCISVLEHIGLGGRYGVVEDELGDLKMVKQIKRLVKPGGKVFITVPYGIAQVCTPYHRIYNLERIKKIEDGFYVLEEKFYYLDDHKDWGECSAQEGQLKKGGLDRYCLALLYLGKV